MLLTGVGIGALTCAILVANNLRDIAGDAAVGKRTLATRLGDPRTRMLYLGLVLLGTAMIVVVAALTSWWALLGLVGLFMIIPAVRTVLTGGQGLALVGVLKITGLAELVTAVLLAAGLLIGADGQLRRNAVSNVTFETVTVPTQLRRHSERFGRIRSKPTELEVAIERERAGQSDDGRAAGPGHPPDRTPADRPPLPGRSRAARSGSRAGSRPDASRDAQPGGRRPPPR